MTTTAGRLLADSGLPPFEARALLALRLRVSRERLIAHPDTAVEEGDADAFRQAVCRRAAGVPLAYLLGEKEFHGRLFVVTPDVLVPRPETELLVDLALERLRALPAPRMLDLGTGSGCIAVTLALELPGAAVTATDASAAALAVAQRNAARLGATIEFRLGDWYDALPASAQFEAIVSNPPYVAAGDPHLEALRFEPQQALTDGSDGLASLAAIARGAGRHLVAGGWLLVEHGFDQAAAVRALLVRNGLTPTSHADAQGHARVMVGQRQA